MKHAIGIVGAGVGGLHLALYLQKHGVDATVITDREPQHYRTARLLNTVAHHAVTLERERYLGVDHWSDPDTHYFHHDHCFNLTETLRFRGDFTRPSRAVDYRLYLPRLMEDFAARGGRIEYRRIEDDEIARLAARFDLLVISSGRGALTRLFSARPEHMPFDRPQRNLFVGLYTGVSNAKPMSVTLSVSPGVGEIIVIPILTFGGIANALLMENVPDGPLDRGLRGASYEADRSGFLSTVISLLERHHPAVYDRVDRARFDLAQPQDLLQGAILPTVRSTWAEFDEGRCAIALGDVHSVIDPMMGQGANMASFAAFVLGEEIVKSDVLDARLAEKVDLRRQDRVLCASRWTNIMLQPPSEALGSLIEAMSRDRRLCNEFTENFNAPEIQWDHLASPQRIRAWIER
jgi:2-polyprenyl-6-methoxyphenol hydroxylase-like FAD-dependent oxidoreductase